MDSNSIQEAFSRHPRPQAPSVPTHVSLLRQKLQTDTQKIIPKPSLAHVLDRKSKGGSLELDRKKFDISTASRRVALDDSIREQEPWLSLTRLGTLTQGDLHLMLCISIGTPQGMRMVKEADDAEGSKEVRMIDTLRHPNIIKIFDVFRHDCRIYSVLEYAPITLEEVISVHLRLKESHIRLIACSIFSAIKYLCSKAIVHGNVSLRSIRVAEDSRILLSSFDQGQELSGGLPNTDFDGLGLTLLQCMDGQVDRVKRDVEFVREQRALNKVFGLKDPEPWSGAKQLVDFLDELFNHKKSVDAKIEKPHEYVRGDGP